MSNQAREHGVEADPGRWMRVWLWSALLLAIQGLLGGFYYETNDDLLMELLMQGTAGAEPVNNLHLYLHGWSQALAKLYTVAPTVPWYGLLLYVLLYLSLAASFWVIEMLGAGRLKAGALAGAQAVFYALTYFLHAVQINFTRPALLLGATAGLLLLVPRPGGRAPSRAAWWLAALALLASWSLRPSGAILGLVLTLPLVLWQGWQRALRVVGMLGSLLLLLTMGRTLSETAEVKSYRRNDLERSQLFDYSTSRLEIHTPQDSLAYYTLMPYQGINDSVLLSPAFFARAMRPAVGQHFNLAAYQGSFRLAVGSTVLRLPGCLLLVAACLVAVAVAVRRGRLRGRSWPVLAYVAYQAMFWAIFLVLVPHLPLRVLQPMLTIYLLVNLVMVGGCLLPTTRLADLPGRMRYGLLLGGVGVAAVWLVVNVRLVRQLSRDNAAQTAYLAHLAAANGPGVLVEQGLYALYPHLSPLHRHYLTGYRKVVMLTGWPVFDPSQPRLRQALTGTRDLPASLLRLSQQPGTNWVMQPAFARMLGRYLNERLALPAGQRVRFEPVPDTYPPTSLTNLPLRYQLRTENAVGN